MTTQQTFSKHRQSLETAFSLFNQLSEQLSGSYQQLQQQVLELSQELAAARNERMLQLAEKERLADRLKRLLEALPAAVILLDSQNKIKEFNPAAGRLFETMVVDSDWPQLLALHILQDFPESNELHLRNGKVLSFSSSPLEQASGQILVMLDVTEARKLQERLVRQQRLGAMGEMSAQLAHQMRTPLSSALLYTSHLSNNNLTPGQRKKFTGKLHNRLQHMERQISDILMFARGSSAGERTFSLAELIKEFAATMASEVQQAEASLCIELHDELETTILGRQDALQGVLGNLTDNALQHGAQQIRLILKGGERIKLIFSDDGCGVPDECREQIFDPFFTTRSDGTGLGLAVVQNIMLSHQAEIQLSQDAQQGAVFELEFPHASMDRVSNPYPDLSNIPNQNSPYQPRSLS
ncbi:MAG: ATP-binding protein [Pseudomonadota bacterium]